MITLVLIVLLAIARTRRGRKPLDVEPRPEGTAPPEATPQSRAFPCPHCGKTLRAKAELAGKKVKCPQCGQPLLVPQTAPMVPAPAPARKIPFMGLVVGVILLPTFFLKLHHLDHTALTRWDEVFHAVVAQNVLKHPLKPTLIDVPYLPYDMKKWGANHIWLHKPIFPFWQIALSFAVLGVNTFALRLPSAILSTAAAGLTYLIGKELFDRRTALFAAVLQAINPFLVTLVQGYLFADHIDVALLFWVEVGIYFLTRAAADRFLRRRAPGWGGPGDRLSMQELPRRHHFRSGADGLAPSLLPARQERKLPDRPRAPSRAARCHASDRRPVAGVVPDSVPARVLV